LQISTAQWLMFRNQKAWCFLRWLLHKLHVVNWFLVIGSLISKTLTVSLRKRIIIEWIGRVW
jgi:hypothetical protein